MNNIHTCVPAHASSNGNHLDHIDSISFHPEDSKEDIQKIIENSGKADRLGMIYIETPANPTLTLIDIVELYKKGPCSKEHGPK